MTDVFISYSRRDKVFTQKLVDALQAAERVVWADWASIPAASDWDAEIKEGIEKTNTVLFVLSPEWIKSNECRKEMDHAVKMGKRLVPILHIMPAEGQAVPPELAKLNWVYMRESDDFDKAFQTLLGAMDTDLDWIKTHTRIQVRALEWEKKNRSASFALRGEDLTEGEQFIASGANKSPVPTQLQSEYVIASRKDSTRRQRITLAGVTVALVISITLGIYAFIQARISRAGELAAQANLSNKDDFQNSMLLAIEAYHLSKNFQQRSALVGAAGSYPQLLQILTASPYPIGALAFSSDGKTLAAGTWSEDNKIYVWDVATGKLKGSPLIGHKTSITSLAFSTNGKTLASMDGDNNIILWDLANGQEIREFKDKYADMGVQMCFHSQLNYITDGRLIVASEHDHEVTLWDAITGAPVVGQTISGVPFGFGISRNSFISLDKNRTVYSWNTTSGELIGPYELLGSSTSYKIDCSQVAIDDINGIIAKGDTNEGYGSVILWGPDSDPDIKKPFILTGYSLGISSLTFSPDGKLLAAGSWDGIHGVILLWDTSNTLSNLEALSNNAPIKITPPPIGHILQDGEPRNLILNAKFTPDGKNFIAIDSSNSVTVWDSAKLQPTDLHFDGVFSLANNDGSIIAISKDNITRLLDVRTGNVRQQVFTGNIKSFSPDGKTIVTASDNTFSVWDIETGNLVGESPQLHNGVGEVHFSPDGKTLVSTDHLANSEVGRSDGNYGMVILWDIQKLSNSNDISKELVASPLIKNSDTIYSVAFSPDGKTLVTGAWNGTIRFWDPITSNPISSPLPGNKGFVTSLAFSHDGQILASGGDGGDVILWDVTKRQQLGRPLIGHDLPVTALSFSADDKTLMSSSNYFTSDTQRPFSPNANVVIWSLDPLYWIEISCQRAGRNFTRAEWEQYGFTEPYRKTCPQWDLEPLPTPTVTP